MADPAGRPIHGGAHEPAPAAPARPTALCPSCREPSHAPRRCESAEVLALRRRVRALETELREVRAEIAADKAGAR